MSQETLKARLNVKYEKQIDCPIPFYEQRTEMIVKELSQLLEIEQEDKNTFESNIIFTEKGIIICGFVYIFYDAKTDGIVFNFLESINSKSEQYKIVTNIFQNSGRILKIISNYYDFLCETEEWNTEINYVIISKVMKFLTDKNNIGKTCKFNIPLRQNETSFLTSLFKDAKIVLYLTIETAYLVSFRITLVKNTDNENSENDTMTLSDGKMSIDNAEVFIKNLYYNGKIVNYGR